MDVTLPKGTGLGAASQPANIIQGMEEIHVRIPLGLTSAPYVTVPTAREPPDVPPAVGWGTEGREGGRNKLGTAGRKESEKKGLVTQDFEIIPRDIWLLASSNGHGFSSRTELSQGLSARPGFVLHLDRREAFSYDPWGNCEFS